MLTVIPLPVCPVDHTTPEPVEVKVTEAPLHNKVEPSAVITGAEGVASAVTTMVLDTGEVPQLLEAVAE